MQKAEEYIAPRVMVPCPCNNNKTIVKASHRTLNYISSTSAPMPIARCKLRCGSSNAFLPRQALRSLFFEQQQPLNISNARRISTTHGKLQDGRPVVETPPATAQASTEPSPIPATEYVNTSSLRDSLQTLRRKNRERLLGQEHASPDEPPPSEVQVKSDEVEDLFTVRRVAVNRSSMPKIKGEHQPWTSKGSKAQKITKRKTEHTAADLLEYTGMYVRPSMGEADPAQEYPWTKNIPADVQGTARYHLHFTAVLISQLILIRLNAELLGFVDYIKPTPAEQAAFKAVTEDVQRWTKQYCPDYETEVFGSQASGLALSTSDIDVRLYDKEQKSSRSAPKFKSRTEMHAQITQLQRRFHDANNPDYVMVRMRQARYPLLSMLHRETGLDIQIVAGNDTSYSNELIKQYLDEYPYLYAEYTLIRTMFEIRGLTDVFRGGLGSYSLIMMIMAAIKSKGLTTAQEHGQMRVGHPLAGTRLLNVLQYYADLDTYKTAISLDHPFKVKKHDNLDVSAEQMAAFAEAPVRKAHFSNWSSQLTISSTLKVSTN